MQAEQLDDIRDSARELLALMVAESDLGKMMDRAGYIHAVRAYAVEKHGDAAEVVMHAERTARYLWERRR